VASGKKLGARHPSIREEERVKAWAGRSRRLDFFARAIRAHSARFEVDDSSCMPLDMHNSELEVQCESITNIISQHDKI